MSLATGSTGFYGHRDFDWRAAAAGKAFGVDPYYAPDSDFARRFNQLAERWKRDTMDLSSLTAMISHPAYLQIISMGEAAIPFIIDELLKDPDHWFVALSAITGKEDVIPPQDAGDLEKMTEAWLGWARSESYL